MTTTDTHTRTTQAPGRFRLPDPPERHPDDMTSFDHLTITGAAHYLAAHLGNPETTLVAGDRYMVVRPTRSMAGSHRPDMLVAFDVNPALYKEGNGYIIAEQGKPPDFVLEIASKHTGHVDTGVKREAYEALGILEYWRFDETGEYHGTRLAGDRLEDGRYEPIEVDELSEGVLQGYSAALDLHLRWEHGALALYDPVTGRHITTLEDERTGRLQAEAAHEQAEARWMQERVEREQAEAALEQAEAEREQERARVRELESELRRLRGN